MLQRQRKFKRQCPHSLVHVEEAQYFSNGHTHSCKSQKLITTPKTHSCMLKRIFDTLSRVTSRSSSLHGKFLMSVMSIRMVADVVWWSLNARVLCVSVCASVRTMSVMSIQMVADVVWWSLNACVLCVSECASVRTMLVK